MVLLHNRGWRAILKEMANRAGALLAPAAGTCAICRAAVKTANPLSLCPDCLAAIPWITRVYCPVCGRYEDCGDCDRRGGTFFVRNRSSVRYDETMKEWLALFKYRGQERLLPVFAGMLRHAYRMHLRDLQKEFGSRSGFHALAYVPVSEQRKLERGFNQSELLARRLGQTSGLPVLNLLRRVKHTEKQSFKSRKERLEDMRHAFAVHEEGLRAIRREGRPYRLLLVDDVYTTGSTLNECARVLKLHAPVEVYGLTWAR